MIQKMLSPYLSLTGPCDLSLYFDFFNIFPGPTFGISCGLPLSELCDVSIGGSLVDKS